MSRFIEGLAQSIPELDLIQLDNRLLELGRSSPDTATTLKGICDIIRVDDESGGFDVSIECELDDGLHGKPFGVTGDLFIGDGHEVAPGNRIVTSTPTVLIELRNLGGIVSVENDVWRLELQMRAARDGTHVWLANEPSTRLN